MTYESPSYTARNAVRVRLEAEETGFNAVYSRLRADFDAPEFELEFGDASRNFIEAALSMESVLSSARRLKLPFFALYALGSDNELLEKGRRFAGSTVIALDAHLSIQGGNAERVTEAFPDAVEAAVLAVMNNKTTSSFGSRLNWGGRIEMPRTQMTRTSKDVDWLMSIFFRMPFTFSLEH